MDHGHHSDSSDEESYVGKSYDDVVGQLGRLRGKYRESRQLIKNSLKMFECQMCTDMMAAPVTLGCGHNFCFTCILDWMQSHSCPQHDHHAKVCFLLAVSRILSEIIYSARIAVTKSH